jgi:hypothetical protein
LLPACKKNIQTNEAIREGVIKHLANKKGLSLGSMDIEVSNVTFRENEADAIVSFKPKGGDAASGMQMRYTLERKGNEWVVKSRADSGAHSAMPGMGQGGGQMPAMPPNHPPIGSGAAPGAKK